MINKTLFCNLFGKLPTQLGFFPYLTLALLLTWGDKLFKNSRKKGAETFHPENEYQYGRWIGNRYKDRRNIIRVLGRDLNPRNGYHDAEGWRVMGMTGCWMAVARTINLYA